MNLPFFIARRISRGGGSKSTSSRVMIRISIASVALSIAVMIVAVAVVDGFKRELAVKISGFSGDLRLNMLSDQNPSLIEPFYLDSVSFRAVEQIPGVERVERYATAKGLLQTENGVEGIVLDGVDSRYDWSFLSKYLVDGTLPQFSDTARSRQTVVSAELAAKMGLKVGDVFKIIVITDNPRRDRFQVAAIYDTGLSEFDSKVLFGDISTVRRINNWADDAIEGCQIFTDDTAGIDDAVFEALPRGRWHVETMQRSYVQFFDWMNMLETNTQFILVIMLIVALVNMLSGMLVIVLESVRMVGVLKTQGMTTWMLQRIFVYRSTYILVWGLVLGNLLGIGLCAVQYYFEVVSLDAQAYLLSNAPIWISWSKLVLINIATFATITLSMFIPTLIVGRISPAESVKYD